MSTVAHPPRHGLHLEPHRLRQLATAALVLVIVIAAAAAISLLPTGGRTTYPAAVLQAHVAQLHIGMTPDATRRVMGQPTQQAFSGHSPYARVWTYEARSGAAVYRLNFNGKTLISIHRL